MDVVNDTASFRRFFHYEDARMIKEEDKHQDSFIQTTEKFQDELYIVLDYLKKTVPTYHPRYLCHMHSDVLLPALVGYLSTLLYNPNNVVGEVSPITTELEMEYISELCKMVGYPPMRFSKESVEKRKKSKEENAEPESWGHLCTGGTIANCEAVWVARNTKYFPISVYLFIRKVFSSEIYKKKTETDLSSQKSISPEIRNFIEFVGLCVEKINAIKMNFLQPQLFSDCTPLHLFNLPPENICELQSKIKQIIDEEVCVGKPEKERNDQYALLKTLINQFSVIHLGVSRLHREVKSLSDKDLPEPIVFIPISQHYCWKKAFDLCGIGHSNVIDISVDDNFEMDLNDIENKLEEHIGKPILMTVGVFSSTEEGAIDDLPTLLEKRRNQEVKNKRSFFIHADAAWGGYLPALMREPENNGLQVSPNDNSSLSLVLRSKIKNTLINFFGKEDKDEKIEFPKYDQEFIAKFDEKFYDKIDKLKEVDSITIDPHKMGYTPYPGGAIIFKDHRVKDNVSYKPPYLPGDENDVSRLFIGQWTIEGSRPGAPAIACYLASKVVPLNLLGYGKLMQETIKATALFWHSLHEFNEMNMDYQIIPLFVPDFNIVNYVFLHKRLITTFDEFQSVQQNLYNSLTVKINEKMVQNYNFIVSNSDLKFASYEKNITNVLNIAGIDFDPAQLKAVNKELTVLRTVIMNPFLVDKKPDFFAEFWKELVTITENSLPEIIFSERKERFKILWLEDEEDIKKTRKMLEFDDRFGRFFNMDSDNFVSTTDDAFELFNKSIDGSRGRRPFDFIIVDINLSQPHRTGDKKDAEPDYKGLWFISEVCKIPGFREKILVYSQYISDNQEENDIQERIVHAELQYLGLVKESDKEKDIQYLSKGKQEADPKAECNRILSKLVEIHKWNQKYYVDQPK